MTSDQNDGRQEGHDCVSVTPRDKRRPQLSICRQREGGGQNLQHGLPSFKRKLGQDDQRAECRDPEEVGFASRRLVAAQSETEKARDQSQILEIGENANFGANPADQQNFQVQRRKADQKKRP